MIRIGKTALAVALFGSGALEAIRMWYEVGSIIRVSTSLFIVLVLCVLLLRSAFRNRGDDYKPSTGWTIFWTIIAVLCSLSALGTLMSLIKMALAR